MDDYKIVFLKAIGEVTEQTGTELDYEDVADILNIVGIVTENGDEFSGGRGTAHFLSCAVSQCSDDGDEDGAELIRRITSIDGTYDDEEDDEDDEDDDEE